MDLHLSDTNPRSPFTQPLVLISLLIALLLGVAIGYVAFVGKKGETKDVTEVTAQNDSSQISTAQKIKHVPLSSSSAYILPIPENWSYQYTQTTGGSVSLQEIYIYDEQGALVMSITSPLREIGYESMKIVEEKKLQSAIGTLNLVLRVSDEPDISVAERNSGFAKYSWGGENDFQGRSFEVLVHFRPGLYTKTAQEHQTGQGDNVRLSSLEDFRREQGSIEAMLTNISHATEAGDIEAYTNSQYAFSMDFPKDNPPQTTEYGSLHPFDTEPIVYAHYWITVNASEKQSDVENCTVPGKIRNSISTEMKLDAAYTRNINGTTFAVSDWSSMDSYERNYTTLRKGKCFDIQIITVPKCSLCTNGRPSLESYKPELDAMDRIAHTFRFID